MNEQINKNRKNCQIAPNFDFILKISFNVILLLSSCFVNEDQEI